MSETLEERLRREAKYDYTDDCLIRVYYASEVVGLLDALLDARDKIIAEQRAVIAELSEEPITEFETLRQAHDAQNAVLARMQAELDALRIKHDNLLKFSTDCVVIILDLQAELDDLRAENERLSTALDKFFAHQDIAQVR